MEVTMNVKQNMCVCYVTSLLDDRLLCAARIVEMERIR